MSDGSPTTEEERERWLAEMQQFNADTRLKLRQHSTEFWKVGIALILATAADTTVILLTIPGPGGW